MKEVITITFDAATGEVEIVNGARTFIADGFAVFAGNPQETYLTAWGYYDSIGNAFKVGATDPRQAELYKEFKHRREITAEEAVERFESDCDCSGDGGHHCNVIQFPGSKKIH